MTHEICQWLPGAFGLSLVTFLVFYGLTIRRGVNIGDEGYLLYGTSALMKGKMPIRDFRAYDPGRYFWCVGWLKAFGATFFAQRLAMGLVLLVGLTTATVLVASEVQNWLVASCTSVLIFAWMKPYYKAFEAFFCIVSIALCHVLFLSSSPGLFFIAGFFVGISLFFGLNIFIYSCASVAVTLGIKVIMFGGPSVAPAHLGWILPGTLLGTAPMWIMIFAVKGFAKSYWQRKIQPLIRRGSTNLSLPLPWLWNRNANHLRHLGETRSLFMKILFTTLPTFYLWACWKFLTLEAIDLVSHSLFFSAAVVGTVYLHPLFSRADVEHAFNAVVPVLIALTVSISVTFSPWVSVTMIIATTSLSLWVLGPEYDGLVQWIKSSESCSNFDTGAEKLCLDGAMCQFLTQVRHLVDRYSKKDEPVFFAPFMPSFYPLFGRKSAVYDIFCVYPATEEAQSAVIKSLQTTKTPLVLIHNAHLDNRPDLRFSQTHPAVWQFLHEEYTQIEETGLPSDMVVWVKVNHLAPSR